ncbi:alpha/beta fold hydrolase [Carboxylicivirga sediminis]|uniref:Alpha/beta fold hydrolase n=1 Tax=Carboxylicivirga sediminis TaxID=2006564 RepID=A0A941F6C2_9BACT|nr:alpha/beta fold hydrolase [Carboxylicivirga sediminis]MBR8536515.1 alpha/beta fold hydrolase [Carboxylicivirga sediminis]
MQLFHREFGNNGPILIILHGLYGASDNWVSIARQLEKDYRIYLLDQRNHGHSPHSNSHNYECMADDLLEFFNDKGIEKAHLVGHSMGGKTAMRFALTHPERISKLVILDIAPKSYASFSNYAQITNNHQLIIDSMLNVDFTQVSSRQDIDQQLSTSLPDKKLRQFLLKNVNRTKDDNYHWRLNLPVIKETLEQIMDGFSELNPDELNVNIPSIFIRGEKSGYVMDEDTLVMRKFFKTAEVVSIPNAGHWLHAEQPELLIKTLAYFLLD